MDEEETGLDEIYQTASKRAKKRIVARILQVPASARELWGNTGKIDNQHFLKVRFDMLEAAGWDPAGWSVMEWERLPRGLQADLGKVFPLFQGLIKAESKGLMKQLGVDKPHN